MKSNILLATLISLSAVVAAHEVRASTDISVEQNIILYTKLLLCITNFAVEVQ